LSDTHHDERTACQVKSILLQVIRQHAPRARDFVNRRYRHRGVVDEVERVKNRTKSMHTDIQLAETEKRLAIDRLVESIVSDVHDRILDDF